MIAAEMLALAWPALRVIGMLSMVLVVPLAISRCSLSNELTEAKADLMAKNEQIKVFESRILIQNQAIETLDTQSRAAEARFDRAAAAAETQNKKLDRTIAQLKSAKGANCDDAMPLVDKIIQGKQ